MGFGSSETIAKLAQFQDQQGISWTMAEGPAAMVVAYAVRTQSTKLGIADDGVILLREGYGSAGPGTWTQRLEMLARR